MTTHSRDVPLHPLGPLRLWRLLRETLRLVWLLLSPRRDRPQRIYDLLGSANNLGDRTRFLNLGYWETARDYDEACRDLALLLAQRAGVTAEHSVLDCGCGLGDAAALWAERMKPRHLVALNVSLGQLAHARRYARPGLDFVGGSATRLPLADDSLDRVLALEASFHFDTREDFLHEAARVLRPGGVLALAEPVPVALDEGVKERLVGYLGRGLWQAPAANLYDRARLVELLAQAGFEDVETLDITEHVQRPFKRYAKERVEADEIRERVHPLIRAMWGADHGGHDKMSYLIVTARAARRA
jgi:erythromycin 3''-O-methyltransferase